MGKEYTYSFIIPHKNCPDFLQRCVDSIPERDDVQVIVVDDNSDEGKKPSLKEHKNLQVILLDATHSKGAGHARNVGIENALGKWLLFADADDYYVQGFLEILDGYIEKEFDVLYFNFDYKDGKTGKELSPLYFKKYFEEYDGSRESNDQVKFHHNVPWTKMVSMNLIKKSNITFEETLNGNDIFFSMSVGYHSDKIYVEKKSLYVYLKNENSILTKDPTIESAICKLEHRLKLNQFYKVIGYPQWQLSAFREIAASTLKLGFPFLINVFRSSYDLYIKRNDFVHSISVK